MNLFLFLFDLKLCLFIAFIFMFVIPVFLILSTNKKITFFYLLIYSLLLSIGVFFNVEFHSNKVFVSIIYTKKWLNNNPSYAFLNPLSIIINILLLFPFGSVLAIIKNNISYRKILVFSLLISFFIEFFQFLLPIRRYPELLDIINNTFSGILGYQYYLIIKKITIRGEENDKLPEQKAN
jgi:glycopeptide antibiotics resistance protein